MQVEFMHKAAGSQAIVSAAILRTSYKIDIINPSSELFTFNILYFCPVLKPVPMSVLLFSLPIIHINRQQAEFM